jgi:hypothetical protein
MFAAGVLLLVVLFALGLLGPYLTIYLPFMVGVRVGGAENEGILPFLRALFTFSPAFLVLIGSALWGRRRTTEYVLDGAAISLIVAASLMGGFSEKHSAAAIAAYLALLLRGNPRFVLAAATVVLIPFAGLPRVDTTWITEPAEAATIDRIMDQCGYERYFYLGSSNPLFGLTKHSPEGPLLFMEYFMLQNSYLVESTLRNLDRSDIIVFEKKTSALAIEKQFYDLTENRVVRDFTLESPPCAERFESERFVLFYRKVGHGTAM